MRTQSDRMRTAAHINRCFARSVELGTLEADEPKSADFYRGRAAAYEEAAQFLDATCHYEFCRCDENPLASRCFSRRQQFMLQEARRLIEEASTLLTKAEDGMVPVDQRRVERMRDYLRYALAGMRWFE